MSSSTRAGFLIPAVTDFADEGLYYNNNITTYEAELPSVLSSSLPGSGNYTGQIRTVNLASPGSFAAANPEQTYAWNGTAWVSMGAFGFKKNLNSNVSLHDGGGVASSGTETFQASAIPGFTSIQVGPNNLLRFSCNIQTRSAEVGGGNQSSNIFNGKFNIFINPASGVQPTPTTPGAIRLSFNIVCRDDWDATTFPTFAGDSVIYHYGELIYLPSVSSQTTMGVSAYLSSTLTGNDGAGTHLYGEQFTAANIYNSSIVVETMGQM